MRSTGPVGESLSKYGILVTVPLASGVHRSRFYKLLTFEKETFAVVKHAWWALLVAAFAMMACAPPAAAPIVDTFAGPDGIIASAHKPGSGSTWQVTSGALFRSHNEAWTGRPDDGSTRDGNGSAVFRMVSAQSGFTDVNIQMRLRVDDLITTARTSAQDFDGVHVWVRYQSEEQLYAVSVDRRDGVMVIKKKCPGGPSNGGRYIDLGAPSNGRAIPIGQWQVVEVELRDLPDGSVHIAAHRDNWGVEAVDRGSECGPIRGSGRVGIRGDNAELRVDDVFVRPVDQT